MLTPEALSAIKTELERYQTAYCGLKHERVVHLSSLEGTKCVKRYGLCDRSTRRYQLGCAHTKANHEFCRLILSIVEQLPGAQTLAEELDQLFSYIYITDIAKGALEKQLAYALSVNNKRFIAEAKAAISQVITTHHQLINIIEEIRLVFLASLISSD